MEIEIGTLIHGTLRIQDLIPAFLEELKRRQKLYRTQLVTDAENVVEEQLWGTDLAGFILQELIEVLNEDLPDVYFGSHPGDGADFGYWYAEHEEGDA